MKKLSFLTGLTVTAVIVLTMSFSSLVDAGPNHKNHGQQHRQYKGDSTINLKRIMNQLSKLDLSQQQSDEIKSLIKIEIESNKPKHQELKALHIQMKGLTKAETIDEDGIRDIARKIADLRSELIISKRKGLKNIKALLTEEQREKLQQMKQNRRKNRS